MIDRRGVGREKSIGVGRREDMTGQELTGQDWSSRKRIKRPSQKFEYS